MYFMSAGTVRNAISSCRVLFLITLIHIFLGNVLVSHNPSVYVPVATNLPKQTKQEQRIPGRRLSIIVQSGNIWLENFVV